MGFGTQTSTPGSFGEGLEERVERSTWQEYGRDKGVDPSDPFSQFSDVDRENIRQKQGFIEEA